MARKNGRDAVMKRRAEVADLYLKGWTQVSIAEKMSLSQGQISQDLSAIRKQWKEGAIRDFDESLSQELAKIDKLEREYWESWDRSKKDYRQTAVKRKGRLPRGEKDQSPSVDLVEKTEREIAQFGDTRYLAGVQWCIEQRCRLLGLNAPDKREVKLDAKLQQEQLTEEELNERIKKLLGQA